MKSFLVISAFLLLAVANGQEQFKAGKKISGGGGRGGRIGIAPNPLTADAVCSSASNKGKRFCNNADDCEATASILCTGVGKGVSVPCAGDLPFCQSYGYGLSTCVATRPAACAPTVADFVCLAEGVFPDPTNCQNYINCVGYEGDNFYADVYRCDDLYVYDPSAPYGTYCRYTNVATPNCITVDCSKTPSKNIVMTYANFSVSQGEIVATCLVADQMPLITRCPAGFRANLALLPPVCNIVCTSDGLFEYPGDPSKYYQCVFTKFIGWEAKVKSCFRGQYFNKYARVCV
jgi:hypothetical protein